MFATHSAMLIHLESDNCTVTMPELDHFAEKCYQSKKYVVDGCHGYLREERRYIERSHWQNAYCRALECGGCGEEFGTGAAWQQHENSPVHDRLAYKCPGCDTQFKVLSGLVQHVESDACNEGIHDGTGSIGKILHYLWLRV